jgi:mannose-6-phosphate isomerase-like protein (cupin superfamily)
MKKVLIILFIAGFSLVGKGQSQSGNTGKDAPNVILENDKVKVTEFLSAPGADACGKGKHSHNERLVIAITDASIQMTTEDGKTQNLDLKAGTAFWGGTETHSVLNTGKQPAKFYAVEIKGSK